jgi:hypothetical protein
MSDYCEHCHRKFRYTNAGDAFCLTANCPNNLDHLMAELHTVRAERDTLREALNLLRQGVGRGVWSAHCDK